MSLQQLKGPDKHIEPLNDKQSLLIREGLMPASVLKDLCAVLLPVAVLLCK
jgi:hypothetical protein